MQHFTVLFFLLNNFYFNPVEKEKKGVFSISVFSLLDSAVVVFHDPPFKVTHVYLALGLLQS